MRRSASEEQEGFLKYRDAREEIMTLKMEFAFDNFFENTRIIMDTRLAGDDLVVDSKDFAKMDIIGIWLLAADAKEC